MLAEAFSAKLYTGKIFGRQINIINLIPPRKTYRKHGATEIYASSGCSTLSRFLSAGLNGDDRGNLRYSPLRKISSVGERDHLISVQEW